MTKRLEVLVCGAGEDTCRREIWDLAACIARVDCHPPLHSRVVLGSTTS
ncbi:MAG: hypothetical protein KDB65_04790 [Calditrichaeota bacterium]|nr:hypothetical protein [Calditrichota bacterium]MCB9368363.1 hypothetical protein [Calditrichota bacterium]